MGNVLDTSKTAAKLFDETNSLLGELRKKNITPNLTVILVGSNLASEVYVKKKKIACDELGIEFDLLRFNEKIPQVDILRLLDGILY